MKNRGFKFHAAGLPTDNWLGVLEWLRTAPSPFEETVVGLFLCFCSVPDVQVGW